MTLNDLIFACINEKQGRKDFALFCFGVNQWRAEIAAVNPHCSLGEVSGEFCGEGASADDAVKMLLQNIRDGVRA